MMPQAQSQNSATGSGVNFDVKEQSFGDEKGIPVAGRYPYPNGGEGSAIGEYLIPPSSGTYVLGSIGGVIQWIATEDCDE